MGCSHGNTTHFVRAQFPEQESTEGTPKAECGVPHYVIGSLQGLSLFQIGSAASKYRSAVDKGGPDLAP